MKTIKLFRVITSCAFLLLLTSTAGASSPQIARLYSTEELEQMVAPIALYPDALLAQVLTAATYPLEIVEAARFVRQHGGASGQTLLAGAADKDWDPSVKEMLAFPDLLAVMDEQLEWTKKLGEAFVLQQGECMDAVQRLRYRAYSQGNLATTEKQVVIVEPATQVIVIEPADPQVVYVPVYDTAVIYGRWWYPSHPPYYFYPRRYTGITFFSWGFTGSFWGSWGTDWHRRHVRIDRPLRHRRPVRYEHRRPAVRIRDHARPVVTVSRREERVVHTVRSRPAQRQVREVRTRKPPERVAARQVTREVRSETSHEELRKAVESERARGVARPTIAPQNVQEDRRDRGRKEDKNGKEGRKSRGERRGKEDRRPAGRHKRH